jgi:hypothetical protein
MSRTNSTGRGRRAAFTLATAVGGAVAAAALGMGTANADGPDYALNTDDGYEVVFGNPGESGLAVGQGAQNLADDQELFAQNAGDASSFTTYATGFESAVTGSGDHGLEQLIYAIDPSAYQVNVDPDFTGYLAGGGYLVPDDSLGYLGTELDLFLLSPLGLDPALLSPILDTLLGLPTF